jgi:hypothetical protein
MLGIAALNKTSLCLLPQSLLMPTLVHKSSLSTRQQLAYLNAHQSKTYISRATQRKQVEGHMRVCLKIDTGFEHMETVSASEPLLSEAAYAIMARESFDAVIAFKPILEGFAVHKGNRGEFLALLLLTLARDDAVGAPDKDVHNGGSSSWRRSYTDICSIILPYQSWKCCSRISLRQ